MPEKLILVTGDSVCHHDFYRGPQTAAHSKGKIGLNHCISGGGSLLLTDLIQQTVKEAEAEHALDPSFDSLPESHQVYRLWAPHRNGGEADKQAVEVWRISEPPMAYDDPENAPDREAIRARAEAIRKSPDIWVVNDSGMGFHDPANEPHWSPDNQPDWVVLHLEQRIGPTPMWEHLNSKHGDRLVTVVSAHELRAANARISRGLSWESTAVDLTIELRENPALQHLRSARHLIVTFESDAAFWYQSDPETESSLLVFDPLLAEGEWASAQGEGETASRSLCLVTALVSELAQPDKKTGPDIEKALIAGLGAGRELHTLGHGKVGRENSAEEPGFPFEKIAECIRNDGADSSGESFVSAVIRKDETNRDGWAMLDEWQVHAKSERKLRPHYDVAHAVAVLGTTAIERFPVARFGKYETVDRTEIEGLRTMCQLIKNHVETGDSESPLNLGIFGPPGSGKSYIVNQIAKAVGIKKEHVLLFNLSQFTNAEDLIGALHQVRDKVLEGITPIVFFDEFDAQGYRWLQYLLAPMEDGQFQEGQITHKIGKCICVFAGATSYTFEKFGPVNPNQLSPEQIVEIGPDRMADIENSWHNFKLAKGPDFKSRVNAFLNLLGMNRRLLCEEKDGRQVWTEDPTDLCFPIRRAFFMRSLLGAKGNANLKHDQSVVKALLQIDAYKGAGRSLQFLCKRLKDKTAGGDRASIPGRELLNMHVDPDAFWELCEQGGSLPNEVLLEIAKNLHEDWKINPATKETEPFFKPWDELSPEMQDSNLQQALRIESNLALVDLAVESGEPLPDTEEKAVRAIIEANIELLAEAEHNGWMVERMLKGWRYARNKDVEAKRHPLILPYAQLPEVEKDKDRRPIRGFTPPKGIQSQDDRPVQGYVDRLKQFGYRVVKAPASDEW